MTNARGGRRRQRLLVIRHSSFIRPARLPFPADCRILCPVQLTVAKLTDRLIASYARPGGINHVDGKNLPSKRAIARITVDLLRLLFPGFFDEKLVHSSEIKSGDRRAAGDGLGRLERNPQKPRIQSTARSCPRKTCARRAHALTMEFLASLPRCANCSRPTRRRPTTATRRR